jgi:propanediol utilization protein
MQDSATLLKDQTYHSWVVQAKGRGNIFNKITVENSTNLKKEMPIQVEEASTTINRHDQNRNSSWYIIVKN